MSDPSSLPALIKFTSVWWKGIKEASALTANLKQETMKRFRTTVTKIALSASKIIINSLVKLELKWYVSRPYTCKCLYIQETGEQYVIVAEFRREKILIEGRN